MPRGDKAQCTAGRIGAITIVGCLAAAIFVVSLVTVLTHPSAAIEAVASDINQAPAVHHSTHGTSHKSSLPLKIKQQQATPPPPTSVSWDSNVLSLTRVDFSQPVRYAFGVNATVTKSHLTPDGSLNGNSASLVVTWLTSASSTSAMDIRFFGDRLYDAIWESFKKKTLLTFNATAVVTTVPFYHCWPLADQASNGACNFAAPTALNTAVNSAVSYCTLVAGRVTCTIPIKAPSMRTGLFYLALRVVDPHFADPQYPDIASAGGLNDVAFVPVEITCSDGIYCNGMEQLVGLKCQTPYSADVVRPCFYGSGNCYEYRCLETNGGTCETRPLYNNVTLTSDEEVYNKCGGTCDLKHCNPLCKRSWECGRDGCERGCYQGLIDNKASDPWTYEPVPDFSVPENMNSTDPQYYDGKCTGVKRGNVYTTCIDNRCAVPPTNAAAGSCLTPLKLFSLEWDAAYVGLDTRNPVTDPTAPVASIDAALMASNTVPAKGFQGRFKLNTAMGTQQVKPECGSPGVRDLIVQFTTPPAFVTGPRTGFEIRSYEDPASPGADTLLEIRRDCNTLFSYPTGTCSDDAAPPGGYGSRVFGRLDAGETYTLVVSAYSENVVGPILLEVWFSGEDCSPQCEGKTCGSDGCTITRGCGLCNSGECCYACGDDPICRFGQSFCIGGTPYSATNATCNATAGYDCVPDCHGRTCGPSANRCPDANGNIIQCPIGGDGSCKEGKACDISSGQCVPVKHCDGMAPDCGPRTGRLKNSKSAYCASDCQWHDVREEIIDLVINNISLVMPSLSIVWTSVSPESPALAEGCINSPGIRALLRFDTWALNMGSAGYYPASATERPDIYEFSFVHGHYHFLGFARFDMYRRNTSEPVVLGGKLAYCMENTLQFLKGPRVGCTSETTCENQGIDIGGGDLYAAVLDCQWLDVTDLLCGANVGLPCPTSFTRSFNGRTGTARIVDYLAEANFDRSFPELTFDNNRVRFPIYLPTLEEIQPGYSSAVGPVVGTSFNYCNYLCNVHTSTANAVRASLAYSNDVYIACGCPLVPTPSGGPIDLAPCPPSGPCTFTPDP